MSRDFDGVDDVISMANNSVINSLSSFTFAAWVMRQGALSASGSRVFEIGSGSNDDIRLQAVTDNKLNFIIFRTSDFTTQSTTALTQDVWYHVAATYDGTTRRIYINAVDEANSTSLSGGLSFTSGDDFIIGNRRTGGVNRAWNGLIAEVGIWSRALSVGEINSLYKGFAPNCIPNGLEIYMPLVGQNSPENDTINSLSGTVTGAAKSSHPTIIYPSN